MNRSDRVSKEQVYAKFGPPDSYEAHPNGPAPSPAEEGEPDGFPYEIWHYNHIDEVGSKVELEFVDVCMCDEYLLAPNKSNARIREILADE